MCHGYNVRSVIHHAAAAALPHLRNTFFGIHSLNNAHNLLQTTQSVIEALP